MNETVKALSVFTKDLVTARHRYVNGVDEGDISFEELVHMTDKFTKKLANLVAGDQADQLGTEDHKALVDIRNFAANSLDVMQSNRNSKHFNDRAFQRSTELFKLIVDIVTQYLLPRPVGIEPQIDIEELKKFIIPRHKGIGNVQDNGSRPLDNVALRLVPSIECSTDCKRLATIAYLLFDNGAIIPSKRPNTFSKWQTTFYDLCKIPQEKRPKTNYSPSQLNQEELKKLLQDGNEFAYLRKC